MNSASRKLKKEDGIRNHSLHDAGASPKKHENIITYTLIFRAECTEKFSVFSMLNCEDNTQNVKLIISSISYQSFKFIPLEF